MSNAADSIPSGKVNFCIAMSSYRSATSYRQYSILISDTWAIEMRKTGLFIGKLVAATALLWSPISLQAAEYIAAENSFVTTTETITTEWDEEPGFGVEGVGVSNSREGRTSSNAALASFGPFNVINGERAELSGVIETGSAAQFKQMLAAYPRINQIDMIDCPGTNDDAANFKIARMIRKAGIATYIPDGGSVRSGGVELFLAGVRRVAEPGAEFAVHSWQDEDGREADDVPANDPINLEYINYYREIGMNEANARAFYAMTNSVSHNEALYLTANDIARYVAIN